MSVGLCDMCLEEMKETRHLDLYISGSEGTRLCHSCEMELVRFIRARAKVAFRKRHEAFLTNLRPHEDADQEDPAWR